MSIKVGEDQTAAFENCKRKAANEFTPKTPLFGEIPQECFLVVERILGIYPELANVIDRFGRTPIIDGIIKNRPLSKHTSFPYFDLLAKHGAYLTKPFTFQSKNAGRYQVTLFSGARDERPADAPNWPLRAYPNITQDARKHAIHTFLSKGEILATREQYKEDISWSEWKNTWVDIYRHVMPEPVGDNIEIIEDEHPGHNIPALDIIDDNEIQTEEDDNPEHNVTFGL